MDTGVGGGSGAGGGGGGMNWEIGIDTYTLICISQITNKKKKRVNQKINSRKLGESFYNLGTNYVPGTIVVSALVYNN